MPPRFSTLCFPSCPTGSPHTYRLIVRRQLIQNYEGQQRLLDEYRYRYVVTDLPGAAEDVLDETYQRCDQENVIQQLGAGLAAWRMPVAEFNGNAAWLEIARLAERVAAARWVEIRSPPSRRTPDLEDANVTRDSTLEPAYAAARQHFLAKCA